MLAITVLLTQFRVGNFGSHGGFLPYGIKALSCLTSGGLAHLDAGDAHLVATARRHSACVVASSRRIGGSLAPQDRRNPEKRSGRLPQRRWGRDNRVNEREWGPDARSAEGSTGIYRAGRRAD